MKTLQNEDTWRKVLEHSDATKRTKCSNVLIEYSTYTYTDGILLQR
jgi:hypothetical protein